MAETHNGNRYHIVVSEPARTALRQFHLAEKRREQRGRRWRKARVIAAWIWSGLIIAYICWNAIRL